MTTYKRILAAVDFSEHSDAVIQRALRQAECSAAVLDVLHVVDYTRSIDADYIIPPGDVVEAALLASARGGWRKHSGVSGRLMPGRW